MTYRPEIDGLRAVAVLCVVLYHAGIPGFSGGFIGVDVFFAISGYLITSLILNERAEGTFSLRHFYARRARRIFPALFAMLALSFPLAFVTLDPAEMTEFSGSLAAAALFWSNQFFLQHSGYFAFHSELRPLLHTWSLAVEEQFYLVYPALLLLMTKLERTRQATVLLVLGGASLAAAEVLVHVLPATAFFTLPARFWELAAGAVAAYWLSCRNERSLPAWQLSYLPAAGLALIIGSAVFYDAGTSFPGLGAVPPVLGTLLIICFGSPKVSAGRWLARPSAMFAGKVSYSFYLWHFPLLAIARHWMPGAGPLTLGGVALLSFGIAVLSWHFVEQPLRKDARLTFPRAMAASAASMLMLTALAGSGIWSSGFRDYYIDHRLDAAGKANFARFAFQAVRGHDKADNGDCVFRAEAIEPEFGQRFNGCARRYGKATVLIGDSHAISVSNALFKSGYGPFAVALAKGACEPFRPSELCPYEDFLTFAAERQDSISAVVLQISGSHLIRDSNGVEESDAAFLPGDKWSIAEDNIARTASYLGKLPAALKVIWLGPYVEARQNLNNPESFEPDRLHINETSLAIFRELDLYLKTAAAEQQRYSYVSLREALNIGPSSLAQGDCLTFKDADHFSLCGEHLFGKLIAPLFASIVPPVAEVVP